MPRSMKYMLLFSCMFLVVLLTPTKYAGSAEEERGKQIRLREYLNREALPEGRGTALADLKGLHKFLGDECGGSILNLSEEDLLYAQVIIQRGFEAINGWREYMAEKSPEEIEKREAIVRESLESLRDIEKYTEDCLKLQGKDLRTYNIYRLFLRAYTIIELVSLDPDYDKDQALDKLKEIRDILRNKVLTQELDAAETQFVNHFLKMIEDGIAKAKDKK